MSANNAIAVLKTKISTKHDDDFIIVLDDPTYIYRVGYVSSVSDLAYYQENDKLNLGAYLNHIFQGSKIYSNKEDAEEYAYKLDGYDNPTEYGVMFLTTVT